jgi:hypothetical protein
MNPIADVIIDKFAEYLKYGNPTSRDGASGKYARMAQAMSPNAESMEIFVKHLLRAELELVTGIQKAIQHSIDVMDGKESAAAKKKTESAPAVSHKIPVVEATDTQTTTSSSAGTTVLN